MNLLEYGKAISLRFSSSLQVGRSHGYWPITSFLVTVTVSASFLRNLWTSGTLVAACTKHETAVSVRCNMKQEKRSSGSLIGLMGGGNGVKMGCPTNESVPTPPPSGPASVPITGSQMSDLSSMDNPASVGCPPSSSGIVIKEENKFLFNGEAVSSCDNSKTMLDKKNGNLDSKPPSAGCGDNSSVASDIKPNISGLLGNGPKKSEYGMLPDIKPNVSVPSPGMNSMTSSLDCSSNSNQNGS